MDPLIAEGYAGKTGSDSAAEGCLAFFTHVTVRGRRLTPVGVVLGQRQGSGASVLLAAAGEAPSSWSSRLPRRSGYARSLRPAWVAEGATPAAIAAPCHPLPVPPRHSTDVNALTTRRRHMNRRRRALAALALIAMVALISACGSSAPTATGSSGGNNTTSNHEKGVKFAECMRNNGVSGFPDLHASEGLTIDGIANGSSLDTNAPAFTRAISACKALEPPGFMGQKATPRQMGARLKFAQCMRDNGVPDFPDPTTNGPLIDTNRIPSLAGKDPRSDPAFNAAAHKCSDFAAAAGVVSQ